MPTLTSGNVLVSGASGFLAAWIVKRFLDEGYRVTGTVRSPTKGAYLKNLFRDHGDNFQFSIVPDVEEVGAFDDAVKGMDAIIHTASPFHLKAGHPQEILGPAIKGTVGILDSVLKNAPQVKRVVVTSSTAAIVDSNMSFPAVLSEKDWNISSAERVKELGEAAAGGDKYRASKALAERAAWDWIDAHKSQIGFDLVVTNPPFIFGPIIHQVPTVENLNTSVNNFYLILKGAKTDAELAQSAGCWVDVRDVAQAHLEAIRIEQAGGSRFLLSAGEFTMQDFLDQLDPSEFPGARRGIPGAGKATRHDVIYDSSHAKKVLGITFTSMADCVKDMTSSLRERGW